MKKIILLLAFLSIAHCTFNIENCEGQWMQMSNGMGNDKIIYGFASNGIYLFSITDTTGVYRSSNNGENWTAVNIGLPTVIKRCIASSGTHIFVGTLGRGVYKSTNNGDNWDSINNGLNNLNIVSLTIIGTDIFAGTGGNPGGIYRSTNNGTNWNQVLLLFSSSGVGNLVIKGNTLYAVASFYLTSQIYSSSNNGVNWSALSGTQPIISSLIAVGNNLFKGTIQGVFISSNNGVNWSSSGLQNNIIEDFTLEGTNLFAATWNDTTHGGVYLSTNNGISWITKNQGLAVQIVQCLYIYNGYIYAGTYRSSIYRRSLSEIISIHNISTEIPSGFSLSQNYPNPFNPVTKIKFDVAHPPFNKGGQGGFVTLKVFDILGHEVATPVNEQLASGTYEVDWNASVFPSGIYFYQMRSGDFILTKKLILLK